MQLTSSPHVTKRETDGERKSGYYAAIYSDKNDCGLCSISTAEQFASSFLIARFYNYTQNVSTRMSLPACLFDTASSQSASLYLSSIDRGLATQNGGLVSRFPSIVRFCVRPTGCGGMLMSYVMLWYFLCTLYKLHGGRAQPRAHDDVIFYCGGKRKSV